jgi:hypothetical protein
MSSSQYALVDKGLSISLQEYSWVEYKKGQIMGPSKNENTNLTDIVHLTLELQNDWLAAVFNLE